MSGFDYDSIMQNAAQQHINNAQTKKRPKTQEYASTQKNTQTDTRAQTGGTGGGDDVDTTTPPVRRGDNNPDGPTKEELEARDKQADAIIDSVKQSTVAPSDQVRTVSEKRREIRKPKTGKAPSTQSVSGIPRKLMDAVRREFDSGMISSNTDALCAFIMIHCDVSCDDVSENVIRVVKEKRKEDPYLSVSERLKYLDDKTNKIMKAIPEFEMVLAYYLFDRLGFRMLDAGDARNIDLLESNRHGSVTDIVARMREQGNEMRKQDNITDGRPIK